MKKILSLCINLLLFIITDAVPLKLIAGDRSVVKKDGATHTISKYYVVSNDFDPNNTTNTTETSETALPMNHSLYSKSMNAITASEHQVSEKRAEAANNQTNENTAGVNNNELNLLSDLDDTQVDVATQADDNTAESTESVNTEQSLDPDDLGNLQVEPITNYSNENSSVTINEINVNDLSETLQNGTSSIVENTTQNFETDFEDELDDLILTKFGTAVHESSVQNLESFWKLIKLYIDRISDDDELLAKIENLSLLLNIFTNLHEAALRQKPIEPMLESVIDILQTPFVEKSNTNESQSQTNLSREYDEECLRKSGIKRSKPQLDSNGNYLSETESLEASDNLELKVLQRRQRGDSDDGDDWVNTSNDPGSNQVTVSNQPTNILRSQLIVPNNLIVGVPDGFNVRYSTPSLNHIARENKVQEDPKPIEKNPDSAEIDENVDGQPLTIKSTLIDDLPWHIEDKTTDYVPWYIEDKTTNQPWIIEHKTTNTLPWIIEDRGNKKVPWKVENRADPNWFIKNKMGHSPITLYQSKGPSVITHGGKKLLHPNQAMTSTAHRVKQGGKKPYHIYTYVINPSTSINKIPNSGNVVKVESRQPNANPKTKSYDLSTSHGGDQIVYMNKHYPSYFESQLSLSKPSVHISSETSNSELNYVTPPSDTNNEVNASDLSDISNEADEPKFLVVHEPQSNDKTALFQPNTLPSYSLTNSDPDNELPQVPEVGSHSEVLLPNNLSKRFESLIDLDNTGPVSTTSASASVDTSDLNPDIEDTETNPYNPNIDSNLIQQINLHPVSKASFYSEHINLPDDYHKPIPVYGRETYKYPGLIDTASSSSTYKILLDEYDKPALLRPNTLPSDSLTNSDQENELPQGPEVGSHPGVLHANVPSKQLESMIDLVNTGPVFTASASASADTSDVDPDIEDTETNPYNPNIDLNLIQQTNLHPVSFYSEDTNLPDNYFMPSPVYGRETYKYPGLIAKPSSSSAYTNLLDVYDKPVYGGQTHQHPALISSSASSSSGYTNLPDDYDEPIPVYGGHTDKHPSLIFPSSSSSTYTNLPDEYDEPVNGGQTHQHPALISSSASSSSEYTNLPDNYDEPSPVYGGHTDKHPSVIFPSSSSSAYTHLLDVYDKPVYDGQTHQHPALISSSASSSSGYTNLLNDYDEPSPVYGGHTDKHPSLISPYSSSYAYTNLPDEYDEPVNGGQTHQHPALISSSASSSSEYTNLPDNYDEPSPVYGGHTDKHPSLISPSSSSSAYTNLLDVYDEPVNVMPTHQHPGFISSSASSNSEYTNLPDEYDEQSRVSGGHTDKHPGFISKVSADSEYTNLPNYYNNPIPDYGQHSDIHPGQITKVTHYPEYANVVNDYDEPIPVYSGQIQKHPGFISEASSHSEFTNIPDDYNNPQPDYEEQTDQYPVYIQTPVNGRPTEIEDNFLVSHHPYKQTVHIMQPNLIAHLHGNQPTEHNYLKHLKLKLAPTYRLFTLDNLFKMHDAVIKTIEINGDEPDVYDNTALMNLRKIINIILILAEHLEEPEGSIEWYEKLFYNTQKNRHPLEIYVYNLIRQRWLHELMLVLYKNDFNFNILQNPRIFSFLGSWRFPNYVLNFMETEESLQHNFDPPEVFDQMFSSQYGVQDEFATHTYEDVLEEVPENLESYVIKNVIDSYKTPNVGIVLSIAGVEAEPDANAIIHILQKYLHYKSFIEKQENVIIRDNKVEMIQQIILFLREKGYDAITIADLVRKLYTAVYSTEGKGCQTHHANFAKNMYDVILPVLRRSGR